MTIHISNAARSAAANAAVDLVDAGAGSAVLRLYTGAQPAGPDTAVGAQVLLASIPLPEPAFTLTAPGVKTLQGVPLSDTADASGTASWFRIVDGAGAAVIDGSAGEAADTPVPNLVLDTKVLTAGLTVQVNSGTLTMPG